jgi:adenylyl cyclase-associated protein
VKTYYSPRGVKWNADGIPVSEALEKYKSNSKSAPAAPKSASGGPPPPPPAPSAAQILSAAGLGPGAPAPPPKAKGSDMGSVFAELSKGENVTAGLKKVDPSMQTHKNPTLRGTAPVSIARSDSQNSTKSGPPQKAPKPESMRTKKPPRKELDGTKWLIVCSYHLDSMWHIANFTNQENYESPSAPVEITAERNHSILITKCKNTTIRITGKANAISIDNCPKTSIILDSLVSSLDVIKCPSFAVQVIDTLPTILLDQVDGASVYLSANSLQTEIMTSKCSSVNVYLPPAEDSGDFEEVNVPEQFRSYVKDGKLVTEIVEHKG